MASNVNKVPIGSLLSANSQIPSLHIQSCKNLEGGNSTNPAILQSLILRRQKEEFKKKKKKRTGPMEGGTLLKTGEGVRGKGISISMFTARNNGISFLCQGLNELRFLFLP